MAKMHSRRKGKSGSTKPVRKEAPGWVDKDEEEVEEMVVSLRKEGKNPSEIGRELRDEHGIPDVKQITGKKITEILREHEMAPEVPEDLFNLMKKAINAREHLKKNPKDTSAKRSLRLIESKIERLIKYYKKKEKLPDEWRYSPERAKLMVE